MEFFAKIGNVLYTILDFAPGLVLLGLAILIGLLMLAEKSGMFEKIEHKSAERAAKKPVVPKKAA